MSADDTESIFYRAFETLDLALMRTLWSKDAACVHPGGPLVQGYDAVVQTWSEILSAERPPKVSYRVLRRHASGDLAVHLVEETIHPSGENSKPAIVFATNTYRRENDAWRLLAHHASLPMVRRRAPPPPPSPAEPPQLH